MHERINSKVAIENNQMLPFDIMGEKKGKEFTFIDRGQ